MTKTKDKNIAEIFVLSVLFLFSIALFNLTGYIYAGISVISLIIWFRYISFSVSELLLMLFSISYCAFYIFHYGFSLEPIVQFFWGPWSAYVMGKIIIMQTKNANRMLLTVVSLMSIGMCIHGLLNWLAYVNSPYIGTYAYQRISIDFWRKDIVTVTATGMFFTLVTGLSIGTIFTKVKGKYKAIGVVCLLACIAATIFFANRTLMLIAFFLIVWRSIFWFASKEVNTGYKALAVMGIILGVILLIAMYSGNIFGVYDWVHSLKLVNRINSESDMSNRFGDWMVMFKNFAFIKYPFGGEYITGTQGASYLHNMWLDIYNTAGVIPFVAFIAFTLNQITKYIKFRKLMINSQDEMKRNIYVIVQCVLIACILNCMVEPIIEANPYFFITVMMFLGCIDGCLEVEENEVLTLADSRVRKI